MFCSNGSVLLRGVATTSYLPRIVDTELDELLPSLAAIALEGAKGVGKTATAGRRARTIYALDNGRQREIVAAGPEIVDIGARPVLLDEWQRYPAIWDYVRRQV